MEAEDREQGAGSILVSLAIQSVYSPPGLMAERGEGACAPGAHQTWV